ncbi:MAG TPA: GNAT family N-acetyltransferase [Steroidobacteraceae bacterium]|jgi:ribosomal-protein-alanine N-acetyltransferase|nr:GNAT family N-acetyltransferase [Steroidobacteraceae bacterium]
MTTSPALTFEWLTETHADALYEGFSDLAVSQFTAEKLPGTLDEMRHEFAQFHAGAPSERREIWMNWVIRESRSRQLVGTLQATVFADGALWIGYKLIRSAWGRGIATAAVRWLLRELAPHYPGRPVLAAADSRNHASLRVLQKCGFAHLRTEPADIRGEPTVDHVYQFVLPAE